MGNYTKREQEGSRGVQKLSSKRKSRRRIACRIRQRRNVLNHAPKENLKSRKDSSIQHKSITPGCSNWCEEMANEESSADAEHITQSGTPSDNVEEFWKEDGALRNLENDCTVSGRRIFNVDFLFKQILNGERHKPFDCSLKDMSVEAESRNGLLSTFLLKCKFCGITQNIFNDNIKDTNDFNLNAAMTLAGISTGLGYSQIEEIAAELNMPMMSDKTYQKYHEKVAVTIRQTAWTLMEEAGKKEAELARALGEVDRSNIPYITVVTDGAWAKRSYNVNYDAKSGVACIIGYRTGKLLYLGVKNKYCCVCARSKETNMDPPSHLCFLNWDGTSTSMETAIIADGFKMSLDMHGLKYLKLVGDGDSSVYRKLCEDKPYGNQCIEKVECRNHLLRNFFKKLRELTSQKRSHSKNCFVSRHLRKIVEDNSRRLRAAITRATRHRIQESTSMEDKIKLLSLDLRNAPSHIFGEHAQCQAIKYFKCSKKDGEQNYVEAMKECGLYQDIESCLNRLIINVRSLILDMDTNLAEHYNSIVCKFVGGKRLNFSMKGSYQTRCEAASISFNADGDYHRVLHKAFTNESPKKYTKLYIDKIKKRRKTWCKRKLFGEVNRKRKRTAVPADKDYGPEANNDINEEDMTNEEYAAKCKTFLTELKKSRQEIEEIEYITRGQRTSAAWRNERSVRLTASNFGKICKLRPKTSCVNTVRMLLYNDFYGNKHTRYGLRSEPLAKRDFEEQFQLKIADCGLFVDEDHCYLGASPDGLIGEHSVVEIKCPSVSEKLHPKDAIEQGKIKFAKIENGYLKLNRSHDYYYQIQGQLAITKRDLCYFVLWSSCGLLVEEIKRDFEFFNIKMLPKLEDFYHTCVLPELIDPRHTRGLEIRNPSRHN